MNKSRRYGAAAVAAVATLSLASCGFGGSGGDSGGGDDASTLDLLVPSYSDATKGLWEDVIDGFTKDNPDITVNLEVQSWDNLEKVISTKVQAGEAPDIYNGGPFAGFVEDELLYPVEEVVSDDVYSDFQDSFLANAEVDGTAYALPMIASARALFVNNDLLSQAGVEAPTDWDSLLDAATKVSGLGGGVAGYGMPLGSEEAQAEAAVWLWGGGGSFGDASEITIDTPENLVGAEQIKKMIDAGATQADPGSTQRSPLMDIFIQGKIGMQVGLPPTVGQIADNNPDLDYSIVPIPTEDGSPFTLGVMDQLMAFENDGDKQEAITKFLDYFYSPEVYVPWVQAEGFLPVTKSGAEELSGEEALKPFLDVLPDAQFYPSTNPKWSAADGAFKSLFGQIQDQPAADVLKQIQDQVDAG
ncbi:MULTISPECIES: extracellular solute-binding protein [Microbacterium]|uniref:Extracellular solute-binding protein n=2 Tax=Microbacterium TaxID=33882 RepID=A0ABZ2HYS8_9MICO|nr:MULTISPECIES: extracellular solute-binding protein [Microbacterium]RUQ02956.1 extracellular solute-binding protein [Microbacterium sp. HSID17254]AMG83228.1 sugar ABC transporter substrate-binding protein [Microbacterium sp. PAMC 28756]MPT13359.1 extracellular solute-binding protein [Microbacterium sp.]OSP08686.1 sugar ABC transporter substrate-binding protein [Microbacterium sp. LEMMJ01]QXE30082.1 extracellular solute-binding protein [Microbacterium paraoxydans]